MGCYAHLTEDERDQIGMLRAAGHSLGAIAKALGRAKCTVSRELRRNALPSGRYSPLHAAGAYMSRRQREAVLETDLPLQACKPLSAIAWPRAGTRSRSRDGSKQAMSAAYGPSAARPSMPSSIVPARRRRLSGATNPSPQTTPAAPGAAITGHDPKSDFDPRQAGHDRHPKGGRALGRRSHHLQAHSTLKWTRGAGPLDTVSSLEADRS